MVLDAVSNFVRGETDASIDNTQTTVSVVDASIFPDPSVDGEYNVVIWDAANFPRPDQDPDVEIMRVTAIDTTADDLTVTRAQETTIAAAHPSGSAVHLSPTAKMFGDIEDTFADFWDASAQELTADVNNQSVSTDNASVTHPVEGVTKDVVSNPTDQGFRTAVQTTDSIGTTSEIVYDADIDGSADRAAAIILVMGHQQSDVNAIFSDVIHFMVTGTAQVISSDAAGGPDSRTYTRDGFDMRLEMSANTYDVEAVGIGLGLLQ